MKILISFLILFFSSNVLAEKLYCNGEVHGFDKFWKDYKDRTIIIQYTNKIIYRTDTHKNYKYEYDVIKNNDEIITGVLMRKTGQINSFRSLTIYKKVSQIVSIYYDYNGEDNGVTTFIGSCNKF